MKIIKKSNNSISVNDVEEKLSDLSGKQDISRKLSELNVPNELVFLSDTPMIKFKLGNEIYLIDDLDYPEISVEEANNWISNLSDSDIFEYAGFSNFNTEFWNSVEYGENNPVFHATTEEFLPYIKEQGLKVQNKTRAISTRNYPAAIFTSTDEYAIESYGDIILSIDTGEMLQDGYTPEVSQEEPIEMEMLKEKIANILKIDNYVKDTYEWEGLFDSTIIFHDNIPPKYISIVSQLPLG